MVQSLCFFLFTEHFSKQIETYSKILTCRHNYISYDHIRVYFTFLLCFVYLSCLHDFFTKKITLLWASLFKTPFLYKHRSQDFMFMV